MAVGVVRRSKKTAPCRLCLRVAKLCWSHVIPEFFYRPLYDSDHKMRLLSDSAPKVQWIKKGERQQLLCAACEDFLNEEYEKYVARIWSQKVPNRVAVSGGFWNLSGIDFAKFKLFHLSVLWRAGVADGVFGKFALTEDESETLRRMLVERDAGPSELYRLVGVMLILPNSGQVCHGLIGAPYWADSKKRLISYCFGGCWWLCIKEGPENAILKRRKLLKSGEMSLPVRSLYDCAPAMNFMVANARNWISPLEIP